MCIFTVKSIIKYYTEQNTPVYTCLLDDSKAFGRINHWTLFHKLINYIITFDFLVSALNVGNLLLIILVFLMVSGKEGYYLINYSLYT